jgi:TfoX/Sxy family transcriptional regulator of competence genes
MVHIGTLSLPGGAACRGLDWPPRDTGARGGYGLGGRLAMSYDLEVAGRVRQLLSSHDEVTEKKMVGGLSFLLNGNMCCGVADSDLMVRVGAGQREQALREPHVQPMTFGGRALSGFIRVEPAGFAADADLASWVQRGLDVAGGLPPKPGRTGT